MLTPSAIFAADAPIVTSPRAAPTVAAVKATSEKESPWQVLPTFSLSPKLGTSLGAMAAYLHYFDEQSQASMFGASAQYTSTDSTVGALFAKTSFGAGNHRLIALVVAGLILALCGCSLPVRKQRRLLG